MKSTVGDVSSGTLEKSALKYSFFIPGFVISKSFSKLQMLHIATCLFVLEYVMLYLLLIYDLHCLHRKMFSSAFTFGISASYDGTSAKGCNVIAKSKFVEDKRD